MDEDSADSAIADEGTVQKDAAQADAAEHAGDDAGVGYRAHDYRPEGRRSSFAPSFTSATIGQWSPPGSPTDQTDGPSDDVVSEAPAADALDAAPSDDDRDGWKRPVRSDLDAPERTMTRRELRILRARAEAAGQPAPDVVFLPNGETTVTGAIDVLDSPDRTALAPEADAAGVVTETPDPDTDSVEEAEVIEDAVVVDDDVDAGSDEPEPTDAQTVPEVDASGIITEEPVEKPDDSASVIPALIEPTTGSSPRFQTDAASEPAEIVVEAEPSAPDVDGSPAPGTLRPFDALFLPPSARETAEPPPDTSSAQPANDTDGLRGDILAAPDSPAKPFGHWSTQNDDDGPHTDGALSRDVGLTTGALTTHALVLPSIPDSGEPLLSPLTSTGEVMVTGTIDLPRSFGSTGAHPALFDHPDVDALIDDSDRDESDSGIAPVRASRAVSSSTGTRSMIGAETEKKSRLLPIIGIIVGGIIVVAAATVVIVMFATNQF